VIVLDTNVAQITSELFTTAITVAEVLYGVEALPPGKRRTSLLATVEKMFGQQFPGRILPFDEDAARAFAAIIASRNAAGRPISQFDAMIAAIARTHRATVATRNIADFEHCGLQLVDPWKYRGR
jgi:hypothetical protein